MPNRRAVSLTSFGFLLTALCVSGCSLGGPPKHVVKGQVTFKGQPMAVKPMVGKLRLWLVQQDVPPPVDPKFAIVQDDGNFVVNGGDGSGIPAGKYKVCVVWQDDFPKGPDKLEGKFDEKSSKIYRKVPDDGDITLDVSRPEG